MSGIVAMQEVHRASRSMVTHACVMYRGEGRGKLIGVGGDSVERRVAEAKGVSPIRRIRKVKLGQVIVVPVGVHREVEKGWPTCKAVKAETV